MKKKSISRRDFLKGAALSVTAAGLAGCQPNDLNTIAEAPEAAASGAGVDQLASFFSASSAEQEEITNSTDGGEFDIIVIGAGASGVPCAVKAYQDGANVLVLQKEPVVVSQGRTCTGIVIEESDPSAIGNFIFETTKECAYRNDREQTKAYVYSSNEAVHWYYDEAVESGFQPEESGRTIAYGDDLGGVTIYTIRAQKPNNTGVAMRSIMEAYEDKLDIRYSTPAVQLIKEGNKVTGVYAKDADGVYYKFTATKGVVLASGDYQNNEPMVEEYCPDVKNFGRKQYNKTGDGQLMGIMVGAELEPVGHTKMIHDFDSGPMFDEPFLRVDMNGKRFCNENTGMSVMNNYMRTYGEGLVGQYCQIFDNNYGDQVAEWGGRPSVGEAIEVFMPEVEMEERYAVVPELIDTYKADTLEELAEKLGLPAEALIATVDQYNELVDLGYDDDFGKNPKYMQKIEAAPFWGIRKNLRVSALCSGIMIDGDYQVLDADQSPIENLYAIGNVSGGFYGGPDYPMHIPGLSLGRCVTSGYSLAKTLAAK